MPECLQLGGNAQCNGLGTGAAKMEADGRVQTRQQCLTCSCGKSLSRSSRRRSGQVDERDGVGGKRVQGFAMP